MVRSLWVTLAIALDSTLVDYVAINVLLLIPTQPSTNKIALPTHHNLVCYMMRVLGTH